MHRVLPLLLLATACTAPGAGPNPGAMPGLGMSSGCSGEVRLANASGQVIEQAFVGRPAAWGADLLAPGTLAPGAAATFRTAPSNARQTVRVVFDTGRAAELPNLDLCETPDVTVERGAIRAAPRGRS